ncbi:MAG: glycine cleavage system protein H [candidate division Zixibacteria bacterium CG_4_9_14_3_um_filter_46_8]|nr:MAG: glycine cleavage system protein H [candidate division Zixibacteria bacterium CG_4_9_14_3_um_filter_46_8]
MSVEQLKYTKEHEWIRVEGEIATMGITDYAQGELGDVVFVELPGVGTKINQMQPFGTIEAVKTVADLFAPVSGEVIEINALIESSPAIVNSDPYGQGWFIKIKIADKSELKSLLSYNEYLPLIKG